MASRLLAIRWLRVRNRLWLSFSGKMPHDSFDLQEKPNVRKSRCRHLSLDQAQFDEVPVCKTRGLGNPRFA